MTTDWAAGYVAEISYTFGFYRELTPSVLDFAVGLAGYRAPKSLNYCELGCGQGYSANLLAAANPHIQFHATDFNPAQIAGARDLAGDAGSSNLTFYEDSFAEFAARDDLPEFDVITLHGIYSWISEENRAVIVDFIRRRLRSGGIVYVSYNALPGWAAAMPLRRLLADGAAGAGDQPILQRLEQALGVAEKVAEVGARFFSGNPGMKERLDRVKGQPRSYLVHEYLNRDWTPFYHADVAAEMAAAKLNWVTSAHLLERMDIINLTEAQQKLLAEVPEGARRETLRDFMINQQFRRDIFIKGAVKLPPGRQQDDWNGRRFIMAVDRQTIGLKVQGAAGEVTLQEEVYNPLLDVLDTDAALDFETLLANPALAPLGALRLQQALMLLVGLGHVHPALPLEGEGMRKERCRAFNQAVLDRALWSSDLSYLASPVAGGGVAADQIAQLFLRAICNGDADPISATWAVLARNSQRLVKDGKPLASETENLAELRQRFENFQSRTVPLFQRLGIL